MTHESSATGRRRSSRLSTCSELVVLEPSGAHHRQIEIMLAARAILFVKVNPRQARRFAEAIGKLVKTDRLDAAMLAKDGCGAGARGSSPCERKIYVLKDLLVARRALFRDQTAAGRDRSRSTGQN